MKAATLQHATTVLDFTKLPKALPGERSLHADCSATHFERTPDARTGAPSSTRAPSPRLVLNRRERSDARRASYAMRITANAIISALLVSL